MSEYKQELLNELESKPFEKLSPIEKCLITEADWRLQNNALQELVSYRAELAELKARLEKLEREQSEEVDEFNAGYEAFKAGQELNSAESEYSHSVAKSYDVFKVGFLYASALEAELKGE